MKKEDKSNLVDEAEEQDVANGTYTDENAPPKKTPARTCCNWKLEGLTLVILVVVVFSLAITVAMVIHMLVGPPQVVPHGSAASSSKLCAKAATSVMQKNSGNGVDGAIAAALCESVALGHSTGLGGGALIHVYSQKLQNSTLFNCREEAPASSFNDMFKGKAAKATAGGTSVAIPGFLRCLHEAHKRFGKLKWPVLFAPAVQVAKQGFPMPKDLHEKLTKDTNLLDVVKKSTVLTKAYLVDGKPKAVGTKIKRPDLATVLQTIAEKGVDHFFKDALAKEIVKAVKKAGGSMAAADLSGYKAQSPKSLAGHFNHFQIHSFPLPSIGGAFMLATLNALDSYRVYRSLLPNETSIPNQVKSPDNIYYQRLVEIMRAVLKEVNTFGDGGGANQTAGFLSPAAAQNIVKSVTLNSTADISGNVVPPVFALSPGDSQLAVQGPNQYLVTIASCLGSVFGSGVVTPSGIVLNNAMGAFSLPDKKPVNTANLPAPGRRPITPLAPFVAHNPRRRCGVRFGGGSSGGLEAAQANVQLATAGLLWEVPRCREKDCVNLEAAMNAARLAVQHNSKEVMYEADVPAAAISYLKNVGHTVKKTQAIGNAMLAGEVQHVVKDAADSRHGGASHSF